ncbi:MAG: phosphoenolpyruvate--protein phosphotransferase [Chromatiales bacterium]|jgi:phosphotransferase system enzyme I (PtsI)
MALSLNGIGISRGIAIGPCLRLKRGEPEVIERKLAPGRLDSEIARYQGALETAEDQLQQIRAKIPTWASGDVSAFIDAHLLMLRDTLLSQAPIDLIRELRCNAEWALKLQRDSLAAVFDQVEDAYLRTRRDDVDHVIHRVQWILSGEDGPDPREHGLRGHIVVADDLTPADVLMLEHERIAGFVTELGGPLSHTAILARSLAIPAVVGAHGAHRLLREHEELIIDGGAGLVLAGADAASVKHFRAQQRALRKQRRELAGLRELPARTQDRQAISLLANIELPEDLRALNRVGAAGVGLYRTEFLYLSRERPPDEAEQLRDYRRVIRALRGRPVTIRTLDLGADKELPSSETSAAYNPALGLRAIRRSLKDTDLFLPQLRAILRASAYGAVRLMLPMVTTVSELEQALTLLDKAREQLTAEGRKFDPDMPVGVMIEVPAAALAADAFATRVDFLSIGTNDLIQYTLAIDRLDEEVNYLYDPLHPAVLRLIHMTLDAGRRAEIPVAMCGEMAGDPRYTRLLLALGLREFSAQPAALLEVKRVINSSHLKKLSSSARTLLKKQTPGAIAAAVERLNKGLKLGAL